MANPSAGGGGRPSRHHGEARQLQARVREPRAGQVRLGRHGDAGQAPAEVVWLRMAALSERARRELERIVEVAVAIADRDGLEELTMRRLATELRSGTTTLYRYVRSRDELLELMVDAVYASDAETIRPPDDWRDGFRRVANQTRALLLVHPWLASQLVARTSIGPNALRGAEYVTSIAIDLLGDPTAAAATTSTLLAWILGSVAGELAEAESQRRTGLDERAWRASVAPWVRSIISDSRFPAFARVVIAADDLTFDERFAFGLERLLDGFGGFAVKRADEPPDPSS
jgi:AcrR family transcriptional regulator